jgi:glycosyltransferase involved in cell wall biosynthesis
VGSHLYHKELVRRLTARGHHVSVVCFTADEETHRIADVHELPRPALRRTRFAWRLASLIDFVSLSRRLRKLDLAPADVVVAGEHLFLKAHWKMFPQTPWIYLPHSLVVAQEIENYRLPAVMHWITLCLYEKLQRWALNHANCTLRYSTQKSCEALVSHYGRAVHPRFVINPVGIDLPQYSIKRCGDPVRLLTVSQLIYRKGLDIALAALSGLRQYRWELDVVGHGELRKALEGQAKDLGVADRVRFHGLQAPAEWYRQADLLLFPSRSESLGLVLLEAMSHGVPCLGFKPDGKQFCNVNDEVIEHNRTGLLADGESDFRAQLESALRQPERLACLGERARQHVAQHFVWDKHLEGYEMLFEQLVTSRPALSQAEPACSRS